MEPTEIDSLIQFIIPIADVLTPNIAEAEKISNIKINNISDMEKASKQIHQMGCKNVLIKGGHLTGNALDVLFDGKQFHHFEAKRINTKNTHGTGCTYSAAIASNLALGLNMENSVNQAKNTLLRQLNILCQLEKGMDQLTTSMNFIKTG